MGVRLRGTFECAWLRFSFVSTAAPPTTTVGTGEMAIKTNLARRNWECENELRERDTETERGRERAASSNGDLNFGVSAAAGGSLREEVTFSLRRPQFALDGRTDDGRTLIWTANTDSVLLFCRSNKLHLAITKSVREQYGMDIARWPTQLLTFSSLSPTVHIPWSISCSLFHPPRLTATLIKWS